MIPTKRFWLLAAIGIPIAAFAAEVGSPLLAVAYDLLLVAAAWVTGRLAPSVGELRIRRKFDAVLSVRTPNKIVLAIENAGAEAINGQVRYEAPLQFEASQLEFPISVGPGDYVELGYDLVPSERVTDYFRGTCLRLDCPLGLVVKEVRIPTEEPVRIYPNVLALKEFDLLKQRGRLKELGIRRSHLRGMGTEFESLRDYAEGDDYRKVDWKATARRGKLVVRQFEQERSQAVVLCVDVGRHMLAEIDGVNKLDTTLDSCLMLANAVAVAGDMIGLLVYADNVRLYIPPKRGRVQLGVIVEAIHDLLAEPVESDLNAAFAYLGSRWKRRALIVNFTDAGDQDRGRELATALAALAGRHLVLSVRISDPRVRRDLAAQIEDPDGMYRRAAALLIDEDRRNATSTLRAARIQSVEAEPEDLTAELLTCYFDVKERSLL